LFTILAVIGLIILAVPIILLIYEQGLFTAEATRQAAGALRFYAIGLAGYSADKVLAPAFYALNKRYLPMMVAFTSIVVNFSLNWFLTFYLQWGHRGLAFSTSMVAITNFFFLYSMMRYFTGRLETGVMAQTLMKLLLAGVMLAGVCWLASAFFFSTHPHAPILANLIAMLTTIAIGAGVFFGAAYLLRVAEVQDIVDLVRRKIQASA